jgi:hypothetical protein
MIFFGIFCKIAFAFVKKTRFNKYASGVIGILLTLFVITSALPTIITEIETTNAETINALGWIENNTEINSTILGIVEEGHVIAAIAKRKNMADLNYMKIEDIDQRIKDIKTMYTATSVVQVLALLEHYDVDYILVDKAHTTYKINTFALKDDSCFEKVYNKSIQIFKVECKVEQYA